VNLFKRKKIWKRRKKTKNCADVGIERMELKTGVEEAGLVN
jgi:hypothetical protein